MLGLLNPAEDFCFIFRSNQWPHISLLLSRIAHHQRGGERDKFVEKGREDSLVHENFLGGDAHLAGVIKSPFAQTLGCVIEVRVGAHDRRGDSAVLQGQAGSRGELRA